MAAINGRLTHGAREISICPCAIRLLPLLDYGPCDRAFAIASYPDLTGILLWKCNIKIVVFLWVYRQQTFPFHPGVMPPVVAFFSWRVLDRPTFSLAACTAVPISINRLRNSNFGCYTEFPVRLGRISYPFEFCPFPFFLCCTHPGYLSPDNLQLPYSLDVGVTPALSDASRRLSPLSPPNVISLYFLRLHGWEKWR